MVQKFSAVIYKQGINPCVDIPERVSRSFQRKGYIPVRGTLNTHPFQATLVPVRSGTYRLFINGTMRKQAGVEVGDEIKIELEFDAQKRTIPMNPTFELRLKQNPEALREFEKLTPSRLKYIFLYMNALKRPESLQKVIDRVMKSLMAKKQSG
jgi:hypothetical protein